MLNNHQHPQVEHNLDRVNEPAEHLQEGTLDSLELIYEAIHALHSTLEHPLKDELNLDTLNAAWINIENATAQLAIDNESIQKTLAECRAVFTDANAKIGMAMERLLALEQALRTEHVATPMETTANQLNASEQFAANIQAILDTSFVAEHQAAITQRVQILVETRARVPEIVLQTVNNQLTKLFNAPDAATTLPTAVLEILDNLIEQAKHYSQDAFTQQTADLATQSPPVETVTVMQEHGTFDDSGSSDDYDDNVQNTPSNNAGVAGVAGVVAMEINSDTDQKARKNIKDTLLKITLGNSVDAKLLNDGVKKFINDHRETLYRIEMQPTYEGGIAIGLTLNNQRLDTSKPCYIITSEEFQIIEKNFSQDTIHWIKFGGPKIAERDLLNYSTNTATATNNASYYNAKAA